MSTASRVLVGAAVLYPVASFVLLQTTSAVTGIPKTTHLMILGFGLPLFIAPAAVVAKGLGAKVPWGGVVAFVLWVAAIGAAHVWFIHLVWAVI